jgi:hypothetical protein
MRQRKKNADNHSRKFLKKRLFAKKIRFAWHMLEFEMKELLGFPMSKF